MPTVRLCAATALIALSVAACGSSSNNSGSSSTGGSTPATSGSANGTVKVANVSGYGKALETKSGDAAYVLSTDPKNGSKCNGSCAKSWVPVTVSGKATAGTGVNSSLLGTFKRSDGSEQVTYNGHALYTHSGPAGSLDGTAQDGGIWYLINGSGDPITKTSKGQGY